MTAPLSFWPATNRWLPIGDAGRSLLAFGAVGDGTTDDTAEVTAAFAAGVPLSGGGLTYGISGNLEMPDGLVLVDAVFKQLLPSATARTLTKMSGVGNIMLRRVSVNRNGATTDGSITDAAGIWIANIERVRFEDVEVYGNGPGKGLLVAYCNHVRFIRPHVHDMQWSAATDPGTEQITGISLSVCNDVEITSPIVKNLTGRVPWVAGENLTTAHVGKGWPWRENAGKVYRAGADGVTAAPGPTHSSGTVNDGAGIPWKYMGDAAVDARAYQADGLGITSCVDVNINGGLVENVWEGSDCGVNTNLWFNYLTYRDVDSWGQKWTHSNMNCGSRGCTAIRCDLGGFTSAVSPGSPSFPNTNMRWIDASAHNAGAGGNWSISGPCGFKVFTSGVPANDPINLQIINGVAIDTQTVPTMQYGFINQSGLATTMMLINPYSAGHTVGATTGVTTGMLEIIPSDGSIKVSGGLRFPATAVAVADVNTLDDYEEGTWTPTITCVTTPPTGVTYDGQIAYYTKLGRMVFAQFNLDLASVGSGGVGSLLIGGLPFTVKATASSGAFSLPLAWENLTITGRTVVAAVPFANTTTALLNAYGTGGAAALTYAELQTNSRIAGSLIYFV